MNELNPIRPAVPPVPLSDSTQAIPLGTNPAERESILGFAPIIESLLRQPRRVMFQLRQQSQAALIGKLLVLAALCSLIYGLVVGTFSLGNQLWAAPIKISLGLLLAAFICLPSLYIFSALGGSEARLIEVVGLMAGLLALSTILLIGFAPVAWVFSQSTQSVPAMGALHLLFWFIGTAFGLRFLYNGFKHLGSRSPGGLFIWMIIFLLVALQMTTALRPIVGQGKTFLPALTEKKFFLNHWADCMKINDRDRKSEVGQDTAKRY
jgi:hypothetical protein